VEIIMNEDLKTLLVAELKTAGAYDIKVADPYNGFEYAPEGRHPLDLMPDCRSVIVFGIAVTELPDTFLMSLRRSRPEPPDFWTQQYVSADHADQFNCYNIGFLVSCFVIMKALSFLSEKNFKAIERHHKGQDRLETPTKLCAYEAGLGVYGRSGLILHPELGNRMKLGVILTDAPLEADKRLEGYDPCKGCNLCVIHCPAKAYGSNGEYHGVWSLEKCWNKGEELRAKTGLDICNLCWRICPACKFSDDQLFELYIGKYALRQLKRAVTAMERWYVDCFLCNPNKP